MSDPIFTTSCVYSYFICDRDPDPNEPSLDPYTYDNNWLMYWWNQTTNDLFYSTDVVYGSTAINWIKVTSVDNLLPMLSSLGWQINNPRSYASQTVAFNQSVTPNLQNDVTICATFQLTSTIADAAQVKIELDTGSGFQTLIPLELSGIDAALQLSQTFTVPAGAAYQFIQGTGTSSIISVQALVQ